MGLNFVCLSMTESWKNKKEAERFEEDDIGALTKFQISYYVWNNHKQVFLLHSENRLFLLVRFLH